MEKVLNNTKFEKIDKKIYDFIIKYKSIILITFFVGVVVNAVDVFTIKFGIDSEAYAIENSPQIYYDTQRYGSWILYYLFPFARYHIISQLIGIFALTLASLLTVSRHNISNNAKLLFMLLFVTYPNFAFLQYFYFQSAYNFIGLLFTVIAYRLIEKNNIVYYITAVILLFIGISSYQANIAVYLTVMMVNIILDFINNKDFQDSIKKIIIETIFIIIPVSIYYIFIKITHTGIDSYHNDFIGYNQGFIKGIGFALTNIWRVLSSNGFQGDHTANLLITIIVILSLLYYIKQYRFFKENIKFICLVFLFLLAIFSLNIVFGSALPIRAKLSVAYYPAFILLLIFILNENKKIHMIIVLLTILIIGYHTTYIVQYQTSYYIAYKHDKVLANDLANKIYNKYPEIYTGKYKLTFTGQINQQYKHPLISGKEVFNASFFLWDNGDSNRILSFMKLHGFPMEINLGIITEDMKKEIINMPSYPNNDCIKLIGDTVVVKLSD